MTVKQLRKGTYFRVVKKNGTVGKTVYVKGDYDRSDKRYCCTKFSDISSSKGMKSTQKVTTDFIF